MNVFNYSFNNKVINMKENVYLKLRTVRGRVLLLFALLIHAGWAKAQVDFVTWESGETYQIAGDFKPYGATFTAPSEGVLTLEYTAGGRIPAYAGDIVLDNSNKVTEGISREPDQKSGDFVPFTQSYELSEGDKLTFYTNFLMNVTTVKVVWGTEMPELELVSSVPLEGGLLSPSQANIQLQFSSSVKCDQAVIEVGSVEETLSSGQLNVYDSRISVNLSDKLMTWIKNGSVKAGDVLTFTLEGLCSNAESGQLYGTDGTFTISYKLNGKPIEIISTVNTPESEDPMTEFLSYYIDEKKVSLTFDGTFADDCKPTARLMYGNMDNENGFYSEDLPVEILPAENTLVVDLSGKLRRMSISAPDGNINDVASPMTLKISGVIGSDGQFAYSNSYGNLGGFSYSYDYKELVYNIITSYTPRKGNSIDGVKNVEIWISGDEGLRYDGVQFAYTSGGAEKVLVVKNSDIAKEADPEEVDAVILTVSVPDLSDADAGNVTVSLCNLQFVDGIERDNTYSVTYTTEGTVGIAEISADAVGQDVYTLSGVLVLKNAAPDALKTLGKGIYIVNGKKMVLN